jgi:hypothetical protein
LPFSPFVFKSHSIVPFKRLFKTTGLEAFFRRITSALLSYDTSADSSSRWQGSSDFFHRYSCSGRPRFSLPGQPKRRIAIVMRNILCPNLSSQAPTMAPEICPIGISAKKYYNGLLEL